MIIKVEQSIFKELSISDDNIGDMYDLSEGVFITKSLIRSDKIDSILSNSEYDRILITFKGKSRIDGKYLFDIDSSNEFNDVMGLIIDRFGEVQIVTELRDYY